MANVISGGQIAAVEAARPGMAPVSGPLLIEGAVDNWAEFLEKRNISVDPLTVWATQPSVRKVVDFIARAIASTPLKVYERRSDTDRPRVTDHPLVRILNAPGGGLTPYRFWHTVVVDWLLFDRWCVLKSPNTDPARLLDLVRVQAQRVTFADDGLGRVGQVWVDGRFKLDPAGCLLDHGYSPLGANGTSPMQTLGAILQEAAESVAYRRGVWKRGGRIPAVIQRPATAPEWSETAKTRFQAGWSAYARGGGKEGGTPILEDGMTLAKTDAFSPRDTQDIEGRQLNDAEVASAFHIAPELVGARAGTYSNVEAFREMLYRDGLGSMFVAWEQVLNTALVPDLDSTGTLYVEADIDAKLRGSFEEQAAVMSTAVGAPWLTRNEARARQNLEAVDGGDALVTPLNVLTGGQASPRDTGSQNTTPKAVRRLAKAQTALLKARTVDGWQEKAEKALAGFFAAQQAAVLAALGKKANADWWDGETFDSDLEDLLYGVASAVAGEIGPQTAESLGFDASDYDAARTVNFLRAVQKSRAANINATTRDQIAAALASDDVTPESVFETAKTQRGPSAAMQLVTATAGFAVLEAARQAAPDRAEKTWQTGPHPRPSHASMDGETVGIDDTFSNGLSWPGDGGDADEVAGCNCGVEVNVP